MVHRSFTLTYDPNVYYLPSKVKRFSLTADCREHGISDVLYTHLVFKEWTPSTYTFPMCVSSISETYLLETIVGDFIITTIDGTVLCSLTGVEIERHESAPNKVEERYDLTMQPYSLKERSSRGIENIALPVHDLRPLYRYLDTIACRISKETLAKPLSIGSTVRKVQDFTIYYLNQLSNLDG